MGNYVLPIQQQSATNLSGELTDTAIIAIGVPMQNIVA